MMQFGLECSLQYNLKNDYYSQSGAFWNETETINTWQGADDVLQQVNKRGVEGVWFKRQLWIFLCADIIKYEVFSIIL